VVAGLRSRVEASFASGAYATPPNGTCLNHCRAHCAGCSTKPYRVAEGELGEVRLEARLKRALADPIVHAANHAGALVVRDGVEDFGDLVCGGHVHLDRVRGPERVEVHGHRPVVRHELTEWIGMEASQEAPQ
jgi:hypothetical protein